MPMFEQSLPLMTMIEKVDYPNIDYTKKKSLLKEICFHVGKNMHDFNPLNLNFSPSNFSIQSFDSIILPMSYLDEYDIVDATVLITAIYYCLKMKDCYEHNKINSKTYQKVESILSMSNEYDTNYYNLRRLVIGTSLSFVSSKMLSTFYVSDNLSKDQIRKIEKDTILKSYLKDLLESYSIYHKRT